MRDRNDTEGLEIQKSDRVLTIRENTYPTDYTDIPYIQTLYEPVETKNVDKWISIVYIIET